ncbi:MAG: protein kinase [Deltaproteobacteria bacterium]|nr:protein kinase [Deltaproteobacteria bacterium]
MSLSVGDRYQICGEIGKGGMGDLHIALDRTNGGKRVALKMISRPVEGRDLQYLRAEYSCLTHLSHPNIVQIYDFGYDKESQRFYFTEEYIPGESLQNHIGRLPFPKILEVTVQICQALAHLHERGIAHGDLKPSNILLESGQIKLVDFGLAREMKKSKDDRPIGGTLAYLAPEILSGGDPSPRSDIYSLGILLFELTTGRLPFQIADFPTALKAHHLDTPDHPSRLLPSLPPAWGEFILRLLNKDPQDRPAEAAELIREINLTFGTKFPTETIPSRQKRLSSLPFVGHEMTFKTLSRSLKDQNTTLILIRGQPGAGKTRFLKEVKRICEENDAPCETIQWIDNFDSLSLHEQMGLVSKNQKGGGKVIATVTEWPLLPLPQETYQRLELPYLTEDQTTRLLENTFDGDIPTTFAKEVFLLTEGFPSRIISLVDKLYEDSLIPFEPISAQLAQTDLFDLYEKDSLHGFRQKEKNDYSRSLERTILFYEGRLQQGDESHRDTLAELYYEKGDLDKTISILENSPQATFARQLLLSKAWIKKGDLNKAEEILQTTDPDSLTQPELANLMNNRGMLNFYRSHSQKSEDCFQEARKYYLKIGDKLHVAAADNSLANLMLRTNREEEAEKQYLKALKGAREIYDLMGEGSYLMNLGALYQQRQDYAKALERYYESLIRFQRINYTLEIPRVLNNLANTHLQMGNLLRAKELIRESLHLTQAKKLPYLEGYGLLIRGDIYASDGKLSEAELSYAEALKRFTTLGTREEESLAKIGLLRVALEKEDWKTFDQERNFIESSLTPDSRHSLKQDFQGLQLLAHYARNELKSDDLTQILQQELPRNLFPILERISKKRHDFITLEWVAAKLGRAGLSSARNQALFKERGGDLVTLFDRLHVVHAMIAAARPTSEVVSSILKSVLELSQTDRGILILKSGESFQVSASQNLEGNIAQEIGRRISSTIIHNVLQSGLPSFIEDAQELNPVIESVANLGLKSILCLPMNANGETLGIIYADSRKNTSYQGVFPLLQAFADEASLAIINSRLMEEVREKNRTMKENETLMIQSEKIKTLNQMAAGVAHEISSPLAAIRCHVEMALQEGNESLKPVLNSVEEIGNLLHQVRSLAGNQKPEFQLLDLTAVTKNTLEEFASLKNPTIQLKTSLPDHPLWFQGNFNLLHQAILNLLSNAHDSLLPQGGGTIQLQIQSSDSWHKLIISDDGPGIPTEIMTKICEPFFTTSSGSGEGKLGIGLTMALSILHQHGGKMAIGNQPNGGTWVTLMIPAHKPSSEDA